MASRRAFSPLALLRPVARPLGAGTLCTRAIAVTARVPQKPIRHNSSSSSAAPKPYTFKDVQALLPSSKIKTPPRHLIDVREPAEYSAGHIPTSKNLPITSQPEALFLPADDFLARFGWPQPSKDEEVVFYCKAGVRSAAAAKLALQAGWDKVGEYKGSWLEWEEKGGQKE
ncbi:MAG: hypothetical protein M1840_003803 [Geoglossum simile]|nr:MAG: hypothetical protein M1840_003803 [Geoglossum simile]